MLEHLWKMLEEASRKMLEEASRKMLIKNVGTFTKCWRKNVGYTLKNVDKKCWHHLQMLKKLFATFLKNVDEKILTTIQKIINKKSQSV
jgi:hypothetical protein